LPRSGQVLKLRRNVLPALLALALDSSCLALLQLLQLLVMAAGVDSLRSTRGIHPMKYHDCRFCQYFGKHAPSCP
jgi:hypothetical protein